MVAVEKELDTAKAWIFRFELESPFDIRFRGIGRSYVCNLGGYLIRSDPYKSRK